ncbi:hypothetical protein B0H13DRAFT_1880661 [Mycena leptocephala]|nr:hypothetical protein B0H13DRAFT_1880661 [Mycena leptocephala]
MADKYYHAESMPNADRRTFTVVIYCVTGPQTRWPVSSFQADSSVSAQCWVPETQIRLSAYLGFWSGAVELITLVNLGFDSTPTRVILAPPSGDPITNLAYENNKILVITLSKLVTFRTLGPDSVSETLRLPDLLKIWVGNAIQRSRVQTQVQRDIEVLKNAQRGIRSENANRKPCVQEQLQTGYKGRGNRPTSFRTAWKAAFGSDYGSEDELADIEDG